MKKDIREVCKVAKQAAAQGILQLDIYEDAGDEIKHAKDDLISFEYEMLREKLIRFYEKGFEYGYLTGAGYKFDSWYGWQNPEDQKNRKTNDMNKKGERNGTSNHIKHSRGDSADLFDSAIEEDQNNDAKRSSDPRLV